MVENIINFIINMNIFKLIWISFWFIVILGAVLDLDFAFFFGFLVWYIILFPIYRRLDIFILGQQTIYATNFETSLLFIFFLIILWLLILISILKNVSSVPQFIWLEKISKNFSKLWVLPIDLFVHIILFRIKYFKDFVEFIIEKAINHLNTDNKKLIFFSFTIFLPKVIFLFAIFYDLHVEKAFIWSPKLGLFLILSLITKIIFRILFHYCDQCVEEVSTYLYFEDTEITKKEEEFILENVGITFNKYRMKKPTLFRPCKEGVEQAGVDFFFKHYIKYSRFYDWFFKLKILIKNIPQSIFLVFISLEILTQIIFLC